MISKGDKGDIVLLQNETNLIGEIIEKSANNGLKVAFNPSPLPSDLDSLPLDRVSKNGAVPSIPKYEEVVEFLNNN